MGNSPHSGLKRLGYAALYSLAGFRAAWAKEEAVRIEMVLILVATPLGFWLGGNAVERALLIGTPLLLLTVELLNSAIEAAIDRIGQERHELSGLAKDLGSAAVFVCSLIVALVWGLIAYE